MGNFASYEIIILKKISIFYKYLPAQKAEEMVGFENKFGHVEKSS